MDLDTSSRNLPDLQIDVLKIENIKEYVYNKGLRQGKRANSEPKGYFRNFGMNFAKKGKSATYYNYYKYYKSIRYFDILG